MVLCKFEVVEGVWGNTRTFDTTSAVSANDEHLCNPVRAKKSSINRVPILYPLVISTVHHRESQSQMEASML